MSNKKQFEYIENRIKQAVENGPPDYGQPAWEKMEALLDKKEKKRRPFLWWFILLLLLTGTWGIYQLTQPSSGFINETANKSRTQQKNIDPVKSRDNVNPDRTQQNKLNVTGSTEAENAKVTADVNAQPAGVRSTGNNNASAPAEISKRKRKSLTKTSVAINEDDEVTIPFAPATLETATAPVIETVIEKETVAQKEQNEIPTQNKRDSIASNKNIVTKKKQQDSRGFYLLASIGPDVASAEPFSFANSTVSVKYGAGVGYQLSNRWSIQTGFYVSSKKYVADPEDYHPAKGSYWDTVQNVKLKKVDANCLVYEIPVTVKYNFIQKPSVLYYASVGASSYIMKEEDYNYHCSRGGNYLEVPYEYTGNKHLFSTLTLAAGIEKKLSPVFSILVEPSFSIPMSGVGEGNVNVYSTALQVGIKYKPSKKH